MQVRADRAKHSQDMPLTAASFRVLWKTRGGVDLSHKRGSEAEWIFGWATVPGRSLALTYFLGTAPGVGLASSGGGIQAFAGLR